MLFTCSCLKDDSYGRPRQRSMSRVILYNDVPNLFEFGDLSDYLRKDFPQDDRFTINPSNDELRFYIIVFLDINSLKERFEGGPLVILGINELKLIIFIQTLHSLGPKIWEHTGIVQHTFEGKFHELLQAACCSSKHCFSRKGEKRLIVHVELSPLTCQ